MSGNSGGEGPRGMLSDMKGQFNLLVAICAVPRRAAPGGDRQARHDLGERFQGFILMVGVGLQFLVVLFAGGPTGVAEALLAFGLMRVRRAAVASVLPRPPQASRVPVPFLVHWYTNPPRQ